LVQTPPRSKAEIGPKSMSYGCKVRLCKCNGLGLG
jgi:hypothetical protein